MWWHYDQLESGEPYNWGGAVRGEKAWDNEDFHLDLGCGRVKKGRIGIDHAYSPGVDLLIDLEECGPVNERKIPDSEEARRAMERTYDMYQEEALRRDEVDGYQPGTVLPFGWLPFPDGSIESAISHHCLEHISNGFMHLMDEVHRVLKPGGLFRIIVPAFPSHSAVAEPTHKRYFLEGTWHSWIGGPDSPCYTDGFAEPYGTARFINEEIDVSPLPFVEGTPFVDVAKLWGPDGAREFRVAFRKHE